MPYIYEALHTLLKHNLYALKGRFSRFLANDTTLQRHCDKNDVFELAFEIEYNI